MDSGSELPLVQEQILKRIDAHSPPNLLAISSQPSAQDTNFFRSCSLCANGAVALTASEDRAIDVYDLPAYGFLRSSMYRFNDQDV